MQAVDDNNDDELIAACRNGDTAAWESILQRYERLIYSIPLYLGLSVEDAADIAQITFTALIKNLNDFHQGTSLKAWLTTVARRHSWRLRKQHTIAQKSDIELDLLTEYAPDLGLRATQGVEAWEILQWLEDGLSQLNDRCQQLLRSLYLDSHAASYADLSSRMSIPMGSIGPTRKRCLERLRQILTQD